MLPIEDVLRPRMLRDVCVVEADQDAIIVTGAIASEALGLTFEFRAEHRLKVGYRQRLHIFAHDNGEVSHRQQKHVALQVEAAADVSKEVFLKVLRQQHLCGAVLIELLLSNRNEGSGRLQLPDSVNHRARAPSAAIITLLTDERTIAVLDVLVLGCSHVSGVLVVHEGTGHGLQLVVRAPVDLSLIPSFHIGRRGA